MKKEFKTYSSRIPVDMFFSAVYVIITDTAETLHQDIEELLKGDLDIDDITADQDAFGIKDYFDIKKPLNPGTTLGIFHEDGSMRTFVIFQGKPENISRDVIVHEMYHAMKRICSTKGVEDEETEAYMLEYLCYSMFKQLEEFKEANKKTEKKSKRKAK